MAQVAQPAAEPADERTVLWSGKLKHRAAGAGGVSTVELLSFSVAVPEAAAEQLPPTLFVTDLAQRSAVRMAHHRLVQCQLGPLAERQKQKLQARCCTAQAFLQPRVPCFMWRTRGFVLKTDSS